MEITRPLFVGRSLIINILGASLFWYLAKVFIVPKWVATSFDRLIWPFLWNGKTETVKQSVLYNPLPKGGLRMIHFRTKCKSLLVSNLSPFVESSRKCKWHYFAQYYLYIIYIIYMLGLLCFQFNTERASTSCFL